MGDNISFSDVEGWLQQLPAEVITNVEQIPDNSAQFNFIVETGSLNVNVALPERDGPLLIGTQATLGGDLIDAVHEQRTRFFAEIEAVLTNAPGIYAFTDENGDSVSNEEFTTVTLRYWVYPDGATQHSVVNGILDILSAVSYVRDTANRMAEQPAMF